MAWRVFGVRQLVGYLVFEDRTAPKARKYDSQGQVRSEAEHVAPGKKSKLAAQP
jgi:hypothetical protein